MLDREQGLKIKDLPIDRIHRDPIYESNPINPINQVAFWSHQSIPGTEIQENLFRGF
jgi:hypothetical protein